MSEYSALFTGTNNTDLSAYTSDSGHTHTKQSGSGSLQILDNALSALTLNQSAFYTVSFTPSDADYELEFDLFIDSGDLVFIGMGIRCETDADGVFVAYDGDGDVLKLIKVVGGAETLLDSFSVTDTTDATYNIRLAGSGGNVQWWIDDADQGTHSLSGSLSAAGLIGFTKYSQTTAPGTEDVRILNAATTGAFAGGTDYTGNVTGAAAGSASGPTPGVNARPYINISVS